MARIEAVVALCLMACLAGAYGCDCGRCNKEKTGAWKVTGGMRGEGGCKMTKGVDYDAHKGGKMMACCHKAAGSFNATCSGDCHPEKDGPGAAPFELHCTIREA